jgi:hypothetical protein
MGAFLLACQNQCEEIYEKVAAECPPGTYATIYYKNDTSAAANATYGGAQVKVQGYGQSTEECDVWCVYPYGGGGTGSYGTYGSGYYTSDASSSLPASDATEGAEPSQPVTGAL